MATYETRLLRREEVAAGTMAFYFERPAGFAHQSGQSLNLTLLDPPETDNEGDSRPFTIASAPHERELMIATRMRDTALKRTLKTMPLGTPLKIEGPNGIMVLHDDPARVAVFLAGGIGITPFLSMSRDAAFRRLPHRIYLFHSNRRAEEAAFLDELRGVERSSPNYRFIPTVSDSNQAPPDWSGETGVIGREMLERHVANAHGAMFYFAGPPAMTMAMQSMLEDMGIAEDAMRSEEFYGY
jgi:ferredoxin-NADP reductase